MVKGKCLGRMFHQEQILMLWVMIFQKEQTPEKIIERSSRRKKTRPMGTKSKGGKRVVFSENVEVHELDEDEVMDVTNIPTPSYVESSRDQGEVVGDRHPCNFTPESDFSKIWDLDWREEYLKFPNWNGIFQGTQDSNQVWPKGVPLKKKTILRMHCVYLWVFKEE